MIIYTGLLIILIFCCLFENNKKVFYILLVILFLFSAFRSDTVDRDYKTYISIYEYLIANTNYIIEPTFKIFSFLSYYISDSSILIFFIYSSIAIYYKSKFIIQFSPFLMLSVLIYYSNFYFLHELTQIRIGAASAIGFYSIKYLLDNKKKTFISMILISSLFHFSIIVLLIALFFDKRKISSLFSITVICLTLLGYLLYFFNFNPILLLSYIPISVIQQKVTIYSYQTSMELVKEVNILSIFQLIHLVIISIIFSNAKKFTLNKSMIIFTKLYCLSPLCLVLFSAIPAFSIRLSELFLLSDVVLLPILATYFKQQNIAKLLIIILSILVFTINIFHNEIVNEYSTIL